MALDNYLAWKKKREEEEEQMKATNPTAVLKSEETGAEEIRQLSNYEEWKLRRGEEIEIKREVPEQQPVQQEQVQPQQEEKKNVFQKVGGAIKEAVLGKDIEGDKRTTWERIQEEFLGIETKGGKKNREEVKQYYENLRTGKEKADTAQELQDLAKIKAYEKLRDEADVMSAEKKEGQAKDYIEIENYDNNDPEIKAYTKKHPFTTVGQIMEKFPDKTIKKYYEQDVTTGKRREISKEEYEKGKSKSVDYKRLQDIYAGIRILESELGIRYESKGIIPEQIKNLDAGIAMGMVGYQQWTPVISTEALEEGSKALKKASEEGWDSLSEREQTEAMVYYASSVEENNKAEMSLMDKILTIPAQSLGWGFGMTGSTLLTGTASIPDPATLSTGLVKVVQTAGVEAVKAIGLSSILDDNTNKKYLELTTPEYAYFVDKTGDIIIEKLQEAKYSEQEESLGVISKDNKARQMAELSNFLEIFSESWGKVLGVAGEEFLNSLIKTKVFTSFANWARKTGKLLDGSVNQLLKTGRFDSILGEFLEEELLEPIQSRIEKRDYQGINTKEGRERMLIEILGFGMTGAGAMIQGYVQNKNKKKAIDFINNNKEKFGIEEGKELDTQGNLYDKATGEIIVPKEEVFKEPVKDDVFVETMVDKTDAFKELEEDIKRAEEELKKEEVRVESEQEIKVEADITEKISEDIPEQMQQEAEKDWVDNFAEQYQELDDRVRELEERIKTAKKAEIPALQEERDKLNNEMENISDTFVQKYQVKQPKKVSEATRKEKENVEKAQEITIGNETFIVPETNRNTLAEDLTLDLQERLDTLETDPIKLVREQTKTGDFAELYAEGKTDKELLSIPRIKKWIAREKEDLKKGLESGKKRLQENGYILKETKPKTQKEVVKEKEQKQKKEIKKVEPKKAEEEVTKEPTKPKTEKAVKEAPKREKVRTETVYHGEEGNNWISMSKDFAPEYLDSSANIPEIDDESADRLASEFLGKNIEYSVATTDLWSKPTEKFRKFLLSKGYDGFIYEDNVFIANKDIIHEAEVKNITKEDVEEMNRRAKIEQEEDYTEEEIAQYKRENPKQYALDQYIKKVNEKVKDAGGYDKYVAYLEREIEAQQKVVDDYKFIFKTALESDMGELSKEEEQEKEKLAMMKKEMEVLKESPLAFYNEEDIITDEDLPFREEQGQRQVLNSDKLNNANLEELKRINRQIFGDENLEIIERIMTPQAQVAMGRYLNKWIQIRAGSVNKGSTYFHEAVHKALDIFLTPNEKKLLIKEVRRVKGNDYLRREFGKLTTKEKLRVESNLGWAESIIQKYISMPEKVGYGVEGIVKADSSLKGKEQILMALADRVGISPDSLSGVVLEEKVDNKTKYHLIKEEDISVMYALVQDDQLRDEKSQNYRLIDISEIVNNEYFAVLDIAGKPFNPQAFPYSAEKNRRETQKTFRRWVNSNYRDIARNLAVEFSTGMGKYRGATETDLDAMAEEWLAENIIDHINTNTPTTFVGKLKRMVELFIDRWFKTMDNIESITDFYDALLSGRLLERQRRLDRQQVKAFNKYLRSVSGSGVRTDALYRAEVAKEVDKLTTKILKKLEGKTGTVKKQYISDLAKQQDIKQVEKDIINQVLKKFPDDIDIATFKEKVLAELLPLERLKLSTPRFEMVVLPYDMRGKVDDYYEVIYSSPFEVEAGKKHYSYELDDYFDSVIDEDTLRREGGISDKYFGHVRAEGIGKDLRRIIEVQSDLYQKGTLKEEKERVSEYRTSTKQLTLLKGLEQLSTQYNDPTAHFRMVREEIRQASIDNIKTLLFPTGQTAVVIERLINRERLSENIYGGELLKPEDIKVGKRIYDSLQHEWIITKDIGEGSFKAMRYREYEMEMEKTQELYKYALENGIINKETGKWDLSRAFQDKYLLEESERRGLTMQFNISEKGDPTNPVYRFYEETLGKYLKNQYGAERYIDERGVSWWKISIKPEYAGAVEAFRTDELVDYEKIAKQYKEEDAFVAEMLSRNPDYAMTHRPIYFVDMVGDFTQVMPSASNLLEGDILPKDVYEHPEWSISVQHNNIENQESWKALLSVRGKPEADLKVYRASPSNKLNIGDWITLSKSYAESHAEGYGLEVHEFTIKAKEAVFAGDDINEFGYYPEDKLREIWRKAQENVAKYRVEEPAEVAVPLPELLEIATDLGTDVSLSRRMKRNLGLFKSPKGLAQSVDETAIKLNALLFEPQGDVVINQKGEEERLPETPEQQMDRIHAIERVLAHEIGHFWDWFGGEKNLTLGRGNILGRIGNLVNYLGQHLMSPDQQGKYEALKKEAFELRMDRRNLKDSSGKITNKARYNALGRKLRVVNKQVRALEENALAKHPEVLAELKTLTQIWRPFDENANERYTKYRYSSKELYADAVSVLLNNPKLLKQTAPKFYQGFVQFLARKKEVKAEFFAIVDSIKEGSNIQARIDRKDEGYKKATGIRMSIDQRKEEMRKQRKWENVMSKIKYSIADQHAPYLDKMRKLYKEGGIELSKLQESEMLMDEMDFIGDKQGMYVKEVQENFFDPLNEAGIDADDVGKIMELERNLGDRIDLANPQGLQYDYARETYDELKKKFTPAKWAVLQDRVNWFREFNFDLVTRGYEAGVYSEKFYNEIAQVNKNTYTPFAVIEYITDNYVTAGIIQARGTTKQVENPINTQMLKSLDLIRLTTINLAKTDIIKTLQENFPNEIKEAEAIRGADGYIRAFKRDAELEDRGYKQLELLVDGKRTAFYVDGFIKESFDSLLESSTAEAVRLFFTPMRMFNRIFKPLVTTFKPSFQFYSNPIKDVKDSLTSLSALSAYFDQDNRGVFLRTGRVYKAFMKEWIGSLKESWDYAGGKMDKVTEKLLKYHAISGQIKYEDIELGTDEIRFDAVKNRVVHKGKVNWADSVIEWMGQKPILSKSLYPLLKTYQRLGQTLEVNSKVAGFKFLQDEYNLEDKVAGLYTRKYVGTPNYMQKGKFTSITNEIQVFSNVQVQALTRSTELATTPKTASGYWFSMFFTTILPKLLMLAGATLLKVPIPDPDDEDKTIIVNPFDYMSEYDKSNYITIPIGYEPITKKWLYLRIPMSETEQVVGNAVWKMGRILQGEGMKIEQLAVAVFSQVPMIGIITGGSDNPFTEILGGWIGYAQGRNPYDDFRGRPAIATSKWEEGGMTRFAEMLKWSTNTIGLTNFVTYDKDLDTTLEHVLQAPILERMFRLSDYGLTEKEEWEKAMGKREKNKQLDTILQKYYSEPSDKNLLKYQQEYVKAVKGEPPAEGWSGDDKAEETRLKTEFKREVLAQSGSEFSKIAKSGLDNDEKEAILDSKRKQLSEDEFTDFIAQTVRYEVVKGEMFAEYAKKAKLTDEQVYKVVKQSIPILSAESNNTLLWELRKIDMISDRSLAQLRSDGLLTSAGYAKYKQVTSRWYEDRYLRNKEKEQEDTRNKLFY